MSRSSHLDTDILGFSEAFHFLAVPGNKVVETFLEIGRQLKWPRMLEQKRLLSASFYATTYKKNQFCSGSKNFGLIAFLI